MIEKKEKMMALIVSALILSACLMIFFNKGSRLETEPSMKPLKATIFKVGKADAIVLQTGEETWDWKTGVTEKNCCRMVTISWKARSWEPRRCGLRKFYRTLPFIRYRFQSTEISIKRNITHLILNS